MTDRPPLPTAEQLSRLLNDWSTTYLTPEIVAQVNRLVDLGLSKPDAGEHVADQLMFLARTIMRVAADEEIEHLRIRAATAETSHQQMVEGVEILERYLEEHGLPLPTAEEVDEIAERNDATKPAVH